MLTKLDSSELNDIFISAYDRVDKKISEYYEILDEITKKNKIITYENDYMKRTLDAYNQTEDLGNYKNLLLRDALNTQFEKYGCTIHPKFTNTPTNVFNLKTASSDQYYFRNDADVSINDNDFDNYNEDYKDILKHDSLNKKIFFKEFYNNEITIKISLPDQSRQLGPTTFNCIEFDSFLNGSYDITSIIVGNALDETYPVNLIDGSNYIKNAGKFRIALSERYNFQVIIIKCKLHYAVETVNGNVYPFGLKHIYLYNANFDQYTVTATDSTKNITSYAICQMTLPTGTELNSINQKVKIKTLYGSQEVLCKNYGIEFYANYFNNNKLKLATSELDELSFAGNFNEFYVKVPLVDFGLNDKVYNRSLIGIGVNYTTR